MRSLRFLILAIAFATAVTAMPAHSAYPGRNGQLLYLRDLGGNAAPSGRIFVSGADGSGPRDVTPASVNDVRYAAWSPDGRRIAFSAFTAGRSTAALFVMNADGTALTQVTRGHLAEFSPTWSPDGKSLAFTSFDRGLMQIFRSRLDGSGRKVLSSQNMNCSDAAWSPRGTQIVFECETVGALVIMRPDGTRERRLTSGGRAYDGSPTWTPDGRWIVFSRGIGRSPAGLYRVRPDRTGLARTSRISGEPAISPDGRSMALVRSVDEQQEVWVMGRDGSRARAITATVGIAEHGIDWQPLRR